MSANNSIKQLLSQIKKYVYSGVTPQIISECEDAVALSLITAQAENALAIKSVYSILFSQASTAIPAVTATFRNTNGGTPTFVRSSAGVYTLAGITTTALKNKTRITINTGTGQGIVTAQVIAADKIQIKTFNLSSGAYAAADDILTDAMLTVEVFA